MGDLTELYSNLLSQAADPMRGYRAMQEQEVRNLELQDKRRQFEAEQQLRELFQRNASPNVSEIGAISPQFAQQYSKSQFDMMKQQADMQNIASQMEERQRRQVYEESKIRAHTFAPIAEQYKRDVSIMGEQQARAKYNADMGFAIASLEDSGIKMPQNFDPKKATPDAILNTAIGFEYKSPYMEQQTAIGTEAGKRRLPSIYPTAEGPMLMPGTPEQGAQIFQPADIPQGARSEPLTDADFQILQQQFKSLPNGSPEKVRIGTMLADAKEQRLSSGQFIKPEERMQKQLKFEVEKETELATARQGIEDKKAIDSYFRGRPPEQIRQLIKESIAGDVEAGVERIAKAFGMSTTGGNAKAALETITQQLIESSPYAPGSQSDKEYEARLKKIGNPASNESVESRLAGLDEWFRDRQAFIAEKAQMSEPELIDAVGSGHITPDMAIKIRKRMLKQSGASR
jgi:hypothetical protein